MSSIQARISRETAAKAVISRQINSPIFQRPGQFCGLTNIYIERESI